jgi:hypothetical protein
VCKFWDRTQTEELDSSEEATECPGQVYRGTVAEEFSVGYQQNAHGWVEQLLLSRVRYHMRSAGPFFLPLFFLGAPLFNPLDAVLQRG